MLSSSEEIGKRIKMDEKPSFVNRTIGKFPAA
jgi:hypothetical protein